MKFGFSAVAAAGLGMLIVGAGPGIASEIAAPIARSASTFLPVAAQSYESGYETTQGRGRGGVRRGGGGGGVAFAPRRRNNTGRNIAIGAGALILGGIIASEAARSSGGNSCNRWSYQCNRGSGSACRNLDRYC